VFGFAIVATSDPEHADPIGRPGSLRLRHLRPHPAGAGGGVTYPACHGIWSKWAPLWSAAASPPRPSV
ncbi:unnamed protein product, partial [Natator depressus]